MKSLDAGSLIPADATNERTVLKQKNESFFVIGPIISSGC